MDVSVCGFLFAGGIRPDDSAARIEIASLTMLGILFTHKHCHDQGIMRISVIYLSLAKSGHVHWG